MDKIDKFLKSIALRRRRNIEKLVAKIEGSDLTGLDCKKLRGFADVYRVRKGNTRIIFQKCGKEESIIISIESRNESTYKF